CRPCAQSGERGHRGAPPDLRAARSRATWPARPQGAYTGGGLPPWRFALAREPGGWGRFRVAARLRSPLRANPRERGGSTPPPVRVFPSARTGEGGRRSGTERAPGSLALVPDAQGRGRRFCAFPPRANPGRGGCCSRLERAPRACKRRRGAKGVGGAPALVPARAPRLRIGSARKPGEGGRRAASGVARAVPGKRGKGRCARVPPRRPASRVLFMCKRGGGQRRGTYLSRAAPRSCASPPLRANGSGGGGGLSRVRIVRA
ncbi:hypothetical protein EDB84DRAFT_1497698, partial [Lactarius hengduanensis]